MSKTARDTTRLKAKFGRTPTQQELTAEKARRVARKSAAVPVAVVAPVGVVALEVYTTHRKEQDGVAHLEVKPSAALLRVRVKFNNDTKEPTEFITYTALMERIGTAFGSGNMWTLFLGADITSASVVGSQDSWVDAMALILMGGQEPIGYAVEVLARAAGSRGVASLSTPPVRTSIPKTSSESFEHVPFSSCASAEELSAALGLAPNSKAARSKGARGTGTSSKGASTSSLSNTKAELEKLHARMRHEKYCPRGGHQILTLCTEWDVATDAYKQFSPTSLKEEDIGPLAKHDGNIGLTKSIWVVCGSSKCARAGSEQVSKSVSE